MWISKTVVLRNSVKTYNHMHIPTQDQKSAVSDSSFNDIQSKTDVFKPLFASYSIVKPLQGDSCSHRFLLLFNDK